MSATTTGRIARKAYCTSGSSASLSRYTIWIPLVAAVLIYFFDVSPVYIILIAGIAGWIYGYLQRRRSNTDAQ